MDAQPFPWKEVPLRPYHCAPPLRRSKQRANTATQQIKKGLPSAKPKNIIGQRSREKERKRPAQPPHEMGGADSF